MAQQNLVRPPRTVIEELDYDEPRPVTAPLGAVVPLAGFLGLLALSVIFDSTRWHAPAALSLGAFAVAVAVCALAARPMVIVLLAACAWLDYDGFVAGHEGTLHWHAASDAVRVAVLFGTPLAALAVRGMLRGSRGARR